MKQICILLCGLLLHLPCGTVGAADESPAEKAAREWFLAAFKGDTAKVTKLTRVPFACGDFPVATIQLMEQYVMPSIAANRQKLGKMELPPEAIKVKKVSKPKVGLQQRAQLLDYVAASQFVEITVGTESFLVFLTKGNNPKVVGFGK